MKQLSSFFKKALVCMAALSLTGMAQAGGDGKTWVDYVNPYIGNHQQIRNGNITASQPCQRQKLW